MKLLIDTYGKDVTNASSTCSFLTSLIRSRCLHKTGGIIQLKLPTACTVIMACGVLHNLAIDLNLPLPDDREEEEEEQLQLPGDFHNDENGLRQRASLINHFFTRRMN